MTKNSFVVDVIFKQSFKIFEKEVLKPQVSEDETKLHSKSFVIPVAYLKSCLTLCFLSFVPDIIGT